MYLVGCEQFVCVDDDDGLQIRVRNAQLDDANLLLHSPTVFVRGLTPVCEWKCQLIHRHGGIACWDLAALAGHLRFDMNPAGNPSAAPDFAFASPHKLLGGPGSPGLLLAKRSWMLNPVPSVPGGGVVFYVSDAHHSYIQNGEEREEAGTPDIVGCIRAGMVYLVHSWLDPVKLQAAESSMAHRLASAWGKHPLIDILGGERGWGVGSDGEGGGGGGGGRRGVEGGEGGVGRGGGQRVGIISFCVRYGNGTNGGTGLYLHHNFVCRVLNDVWGIQARGGCACAGPYAQHLLGMDARLSDRFSSCLERSGQEILRPGFARVGVHFTMSAHELEVLEKAVLWVADHGWRLLAAYTFQVGLGCWSLLCAVLETLKYFCVLIRVFLDLNHEWSFLRSPLMKKPTNCSRFVLTTSETGGDGRVEAQA
jgi:selenocysteine lyase/cysteine desulfurase